MRMLAALLLFALAGCETDSLPEPSAPPKSAPLVKSSPEQGSSVVPETPSPPAITPWVTLFEDRPMERRTQVSAKVADLIDHLRAKGIDGVIIVHPFKMSGAEEVVGCNGDGWSFGIWRYPDAKVASGLGLHNATRLRGHAGYANGAFVLKVGRYSGSEEQIAKIVAAFMEYKP
jgi:hypothetical protein